MTLQQILLDADVKKPIALDVAFAIDCSGSMENEFRDGIVAKLVSYIQEFAKAVDDDGTVETIGFNANATQVNTLTVTENISDFIAKNYRAGGGTAYAEAIKGLSDKVDHNNPSLIFVLTDGDNQDKDETRKLLTELADTQKRQYIHFIRAGTDATEIEFIEKVAKELSNVGYSDFPNIRADSEVFFKSLITQELSTFLNSIA
jgi:uncharacterized protein YegL